MQSRILDFISSGAGNFEELALEVFAFQRTHNPIYRAYCDGQPAVVHWKQIPAVPTSAFKDFTLTCFPVEETEAEFHTSGTTTMKTGKHFMRTTQLYDAAIRPHFAANLLPDEARLRMLVLTPSPEEAPHSSLSHMMGVVVREFGADRSEFFVERGTLNVKRLVDELRAASEPVFLLGTAFAFVHLFAYCADSNIRLRLANGSRAMETGGFKGRSREMSKPELYAQFEKFLGIPTSRIVNEYGMTELSTQFYDETLRVGKRTDHKRVPPWARVLIIDPNTGREAAMNERGLIRVFDLANLWSNMVLQTEDLGISHGESFEILGRATGAEVRGCSLTAESLRMT